MEHNASMWPTERYGYVDCVKPSTDLGLYFTIMRGIERFILQSEILRFTDLKEGQCVLTADNG